ncbi:uncharacterized protein BX664DRAFT_113634 [Halteromyces radiatus]|uniref:uncharacterized protein n=1 Tax=Halteromyces radiatus TaxID=101107 RepID=UPI00221ED921|nr:uncharacterized protein BX664DRAFT_113634 [Halteromyces radiatus]KAI8093754.1 hypothetical protein BX664DRAFT_113634 [Halteromyces radiatus]
MAPSHSTSKRKTVLPLHIDTASFLNPPQHVNPSTTLSNLIYHPFNTWRRYSHKRQMTLLFILLTISLCWNFIQYGSGWRRGRTNLSDGDAAIWVNDPLPSAPLTRHRHAVVVTGHAIYIGPSKNETALRDETNWVLEPYQQGQVKTFLDHIQKGIDLLVSDPQALLIFSGGQTRPSAGPISEGLSYWQAAQTLILQQLPKTLDDLNTLSRRMIVEEYARDSYENILYSLCRFSEMTSDYPSKLTVIGFDFKRPRFEQLHINAIRYPREQFEYIGIDPVSFMEGTVALSNEEGDDQQDLKESGNQLADVARQGELHNSYKPFQTDLYACRGTLRQKKLDRNPYRRRPPYRSTCPILAPLFDYCPSNNMIFKGPLPWSP